MIVAFQGADGRASEAYHLIDRGRAPTLIISPATPSQLKAYDRLYQPTKKFESIIEQQARTTFENALYTAHIIKRYGFKSVILITSWNHTPRSYFLLNMLLLGSDIDVKIKSVATGRLDQGNWFRHAIGWKMIYNEMLETWGSLVEWIKYLNRGDLSDIQPGKSGFFSGLKDFLLFDIDWQKL
ncbi:conserved uncharacterized protein, DUF218 [Desulfosarcina variabilis str. Montpellier]|uniref:YdcF family protein n=1 Tax=Desulfosarcina variabilis TaxID=2300 RepID=UPI003AFA31F1